MCKSVHPRGGVPAKVLYILKKFWTYLRTRIIGFSYAVLCYCVVCSILAVGAIMTSLF